MGPSQPVLMWNVLEICLLATISKASISCNSTHYIDFGKTGEVFCEYPLSFLSVRWYREDDITPIAFIEDGTKQVTPGYDITVSGDLVINKVELGDDGDYTISVLSRLGRNEKRNIKVYVTVSLSSKPTLVDCLSSTDTLCLIIDEDKKATTLLCTAKNARPAVNLEWYAIIGEGFQTVEETASETIMNETSTMYQSSSVLSYDQTAFSLQSFKCKAKGMAVKSSLEASKLVEGLQRPTFVNQNNVVIEVNTFLRLNCSESSYQVGRWKINYYNGTTLVLPEIFPGHFYGPYMGNERYILRNDGSISVYAIKQSDEAMYECLYFDGYQTGITIATVTVIVNPNPTAIVIQGCTESKECEIDVMQRGVLTASVFGSRPFVELNCVMDDVLHSDALLFNEKNQMVVHPGSGTYDTIYTVKYDIPECSKSVHIVCRVSPGSFHESLSPVKVTLIADTLGCGESGGQLGLTLVLIIMTLFLSGGVVSFVLLKRNKGVSFRSIKGEKHTREEVITLSEKTDVDVLLQQLSENFEEHFQDLMEHWDNFRKDSIETFTDSLSDLFEKKKFSVDDFMTLLSENLKEKKISHTTFVDFTENLFSTNQLTKEKILASLTLLLQENVLTGEELTDMMQRYSESCMISVEDLMAGLRKDTKEKTISHSTFVYITGQLFSAGQFFEEKLLTAVHASLKENELSIDDFMTALRKNMKENKIPHPTFVHMTGELFRKKQLSKEKLLTSLNALLQKSAISKEELTQMIMQYHLSYKMDIEIVSKSEEGKERMAMEIHKLRTQGTDDYKLYQCFEDILNKKLGRKGLSILKQKIDSEDDPYEVISNPGEKEGDQLEQVEGDQHDNLHQFVPNSLKGTPKQQGCEKHGKNHRYDDIEDLKPYMEDFTVVFVEALICSVDDQVMNHSDCEAMLETGIAEKQIQQSDCLAALNDCSRQQWISDDTQLQFLGRKFWVDKISASTCTKKALQLLVQEKIQPEVFIQWLFDCLERKVMPKECFEKHVRKDMIQGKEQFWFQFITKLRNAILTEKHSDKDLAQGLFNEVVRKTKVKPKSLQGLINEMNITQDEKVILLGYFK